MKARLQKALRTTAFALCQPFAGLAFGQTFTVGVMTDLTGPSRDMNGPGSVATVQI